MSIRSCNGRCKLKQVIDEVRLLANNVEELRAEISALRNNRNIESNDGVQFLPEDCCEINDNIRTGPLHRIKKYIKKIGDVITWKEKIFSTNSEVFQACTNLDSTLCPDSNYSAKPGRNEDEQLPCRPATITVPIRNKAKYFDDRSSQTERHCPSKKCRMQITELSREHYDSDLSVASSTSESTLDINRPCSWKHTNRLVSPRKKCLVTQHVQTAFDDKITWVDNSIENRTVPREHDNLYFHSKYQNSYCSNVNLRKIRNAKYNCTDDCPYFRRKESCKGYSCNRSYLESNVDRIIRPERETPSSISSISVDMEVNICKNTFDDVDAFSKRRKGRTYVIDQTDGNHSHRWFDRYARNTVCVQEQSSTSKLPIDTSTSDLRLFKPPTTRKRQIFPKIIMLRRRSKTTRSRLTSPTQFCHPNGSSSTSRSSETWWMDENYFDTRVFYDSPASKVFCPVAREHRVYTALVDTQFSVYT